MLFLLRNLLYNRVLLLDVPKDTILERLTLRSTDPQTGERLEIYEIMSNTEAWIRPSKFL
jgi:hypothetical protein